MYIVMKYAIEYTNMGHPLRYGFHDKQVVFIWIGATHLKCAAISECVCFWLGSHAFAIYQTEHTAKNQFGDALYQGV